MDRSPPARSLSPGRLACLLAFLAVCGGGWGGEPHDLWDYAPQDVPPAPSAPARAGSLVPWLRNGGFESLTSGGQPEFWTQAREAFADADPSLARSGAVSVRSSFLFSWGQDLLAPASPYQSFAVTGHAAAELPFERVRVRVAQWNSDGRHVGDSDHSTTAGGAGRYFPFWTTHDVLPEAARMTLFPGAAPRQSWLRFDDLHLYAEQLQTSGSPVGERWTISGGTEEPGVLHLGDGAMASQRVVGGRGNQSYFVTGTAAASSSATVQIEEHWLPLSAASTTGTSRLDLLLPPGTSSFVADLPRPLGQPGGPVDLTLRVTTPGPLQLSDLRRGFARVEPPVLKTGPFSPDPVLRLTAAWPEDLTSAAVEISNGSSAPPLSLPVELHGSTVRASWSAPDLTSGTWTARFALTDSTSRTVRISRPFQVLRDDSVTSEIPALAQAGFVRCAWLYVIREAEDGTIDELARLAREDGFNFAMFQCRPDQLPAVRRAAEREGLPFFVQTQEARALFADYLGRDHFSGSDYGRQMHEIHAAVTTSPLFQGVYTVDEPVGDEAVELVHRTNVALVQHGGLGLPFQVFGDYIPPGYLERAASPVAMVDQYPFYSANPPGNTQALLQLLRRTNDYVWAAQSIGRRLWLLPQAFEADDDLRFRRVSVAMHRAQLGAGVLAGVKGMVPFTYTSVGHFEGIRTPSLGPAEKHQAYVEFNRLMDRLGPFIISLSAPQLDSRAPAPFALSFSETTTGSRVAMLLNADDEVTQTLEMSLSPPAAQPLYDLVSGRLLAVQGSETLVASAGPGEWMSIELGGTSVTQLAHVPAPRPRQRLLELPLTHAFRVAHVSGASARPLQLSFDSSATRLAVSSEFAYAPTTSHIYRLESGGQVVEVPAPVRFPAERRFFLPDDRVVYASPFLGMRVFAGDSPGVDPQLELAGLSGGAWDVVADAGRLWMTLDGYGLREASFAGGILHSSEVGASESDSYGQLFGPFAGGRVAILVHDRGIFTAASGQLEENHHAKEELRRIHSNASLSSSGVLAVPRLQGGIALFRLDASGDATWAGNAAFDATDVTATQWITDDLLAVADSISGVRFYRVSPGLDLVPLGIWRPGEAPLFHIRSLACGGGRLAVGLEDGRVLVADVTPVTSPASAGGDWQLYE